MKKKTASESHLGIIMLIIFVIPVLLNFAGPTKGWISRFISVRKTNTHVPQQDINARKTNNKTDQTNRKQLANNHKAGFAPQLSNFVKPMEESMPAALQSGMGNAPPLTPGIHGNISQIADIWIKAETPVDAPLRIEHCTDPFSKRIVRVLAANPDEKEFLTPYEFEVKDAGNYKFYAALIPQGESYASPVEYRFDQEEWQKIIPIKGKRIKWGVSNAINWESLGRRELTAGIHRLELRFNEKARNGNWSFMCDGIVGFRQDAGKIKVNSILFNTTPQAGETVAVEAVVSGGSQPAAAVLSLGGQVILSESVFLQRGTNRFSLTLPEYLGANTYQIKLVSLSDSNDVFGQRSFTIPAMPPAILPGVLEEVTVEGAVCDIRFASPLKNDINISCFLFVKEKVYAVETFQAKKGQTQLTGTFSKPFMATAAGHSAKLVFRACPGITTNKVTLSRKFPGSRKKLPKPINYGIFVDRYGHAHPWYMSRKYQYVFDGEIYFPVGGMWCPSTLGYSGLDSATIKKRLEHDKQTLDNLLEYGLNDVYLNLAGGALPVRQYFLDMLERRGVHYGYQLGNAKNTIPSFFISRDNPAGGNRWQGLIHGQYSNGQIIAEMPKSYKVAGFLIVPETLSPQTCFMASFEDTEGKDTRHHIIDLAVEQDFKKIRRAAVNIKLPLPDNSNVIIIPLLHSKMHHANVWDPTVRKTITERLSWIKDIQWGSHLRCFIDPLGNETHMLNSTENLRQYTPHINADFRRWLKNKYRTLSALQKSWKIEVSDFAEAARLIPLRVNDSLWLCDPDSGRIHKSSLSKSIAWIDYNDMIRDTFAAYSDDFAVQIKSLVNVPVVNKLVGAVGTKLHISRKYLGFDGIGYEVYLNHGQPLAGHGGAARAAAEAASHTMWKIGTEVGHSAKVGNEDVKFFKSEAAVKNLARELSTTGIQGFYFFGFDLRPNNMWKNHNFHDFPAGLQWVKDIKAKYADGTTLASPSSFVYPGGYTWWWWTTRWKSLYDYDCNEFPLSVKISGNEWASNTDVLPENFKRVIVNCPNPPFSLKYAEDINRLIKENKNMIYVGFRNDLGVIQELDRFFTADKITFDDGSVAQVLNSMPGTKTLATHNGKPWAIKSGNMVIMTRTPTQVRKNNPAPHGHGLKYLNREWIK